MLLLILLLGTGSLLATLAYRPQRAATLTMATPSAMLPVENFNELEQFADRPGLYRWTKGMGTIKLPNPGGPRTIQLVLAGGPGRSIVTRVRESGAGVAFTVAPEPRSYALLFPSTAGERTTLRIDAPIVASNRRELGVVVGDLTVMGGRGLPLRVLFALAFATIGVYALLRRAGIGALVAAPLVAALQGVVVAWQAAGAWRYGLFGSLLLLGGAASILAVVLERWRSANVDHASPSVHLVKRDWQVIALLVVIALALRLPWLIAPDPVGDLELSARRMGELYRNGLAGSYTYDGDYMPIRLYVLRGLSRLVLPFGGDFRAPLPSATLVLIKLPGLISDLLTVALIYVWSRRWRTIRAAALIAALYTLSPPVWINVAWWGQVDAFLILPLLLMVVLLDRSAGRWSWVSWAIALLIKPQAIIFAPLLFFVTLRRYGSRGVLWGGALAIGLIALVCTPLVLAGQGPGLLQAYLGSVGRFPRLTNDAYNLWYLLTLGESGADIGQGIGPFSFSTIGMLLMGIAVVIVALPLWRRNDGPARAEAAAVTALAFFLLPTQIHERYLFLTLPFLALGIASDERIGVPYTILVFTATLNVLGTLRGFTPIAYPYLAMEPLPLIISVINLAVFGYMIWHLLRTCGVLDRRMLTLSTVGQRSTLR